MTFSRRTLKFLAALSFALLLTGVAIACGGKDAQVDPDQEVIQATGTPTAGETPAPTQPRAINKPGIPTSQPQPAPTERTGESHTLTTATPAQVT